MKQEPTRNYNSARQDKQLKAHKKLRAEAELVWRNCGKDEQSAYSRITNYFVTGKIGFGEYSSLRNHICHIAEKERTANGR